MVYHKNVRVLGWAKSRLYNSSPSYRFKLVAYSMLYSLKPLVNPRIQDRADWFFWGKYVKGNVHTSDMLSNMLSTLDESPVSLFELEERINIFDIPLKLKLALSYASRYRSTGAGFFESFVLGLCAAKGCIETDRIDAFIHSNLNHIRCIITFCDAIGIENLIAQIAINNKIKTITIQHGQYRILDSRNMSPDAEAYANFVSDLMLCWGHETITEFEEYGISKSRLISCGRLLKPMQNQIEKSQLSRHFGLILAGENQAQSNESLIKFANDTADDLNYTYSIRLHPSNPADKYKNMVNSRCTSMFKTSDNYKYFTSHDFSIMTMSGLFIDCIEARHPFLFYDNGSLADVFIRSGLSVRLGDSIKEKLCVFSSEFFEDLAKKYNDQENQNSKIIKAIKQPCLD